MAWSSPHLCPVLSSSHCGLPTATRACRRGPHPPPPTGLSYPHPGTVSLPVALAVWCVPCIPFISGDLSLMSVCQHHKIGTMSSLFLLVNKSPITRTKSVFNKHFFNDWIVQTIQCNIIIIAFFQEILNAYSILH